VLLLARCSVTHSRFPLYTTQNTPATPSPYPSQQPQEKKDLNLPIHKRCYNSCLTCLRQNGCSSHGMKQQEGPDGLYYRDDFNDFSWSCSSGTTDEAGIWMNNSDQAGTVMSCLVWLLLGALCLGNALVCVSHLMCRVSHPITVYRHLLYTVYSAVTVTFLAKTGGVPVVLSHAYCILCALALASHAKTTLTDPGSVPLSAVPTELQRRNEKLSMCSQCQTFKPPLSHHCRICNR